MSSVVRKAGFIVSDQQEGRREGGREREERGRGVVGEAEGRKEVIHLLTHLLKALQNPRGTKHCPRPSGDNFKVSQGDGLVLTSPCLPFLPHTEGI